MKKAISTWCLPNPPVAKRNTAIEYKMSGNYFGQLSSAETIEFRSDWVIMINLGSRPSVTTTTETAVKIDKSNSMIDKLSIIFDEVMGINEKKSLDREMISCL
jgi:hypothetical protein